MNRKKTKKYFCIRNSKGEYWNNDFGWIELEDDEDDSPFTIFTEEERNKFNCVVDGHWEEMK